jgi:hypothetical protein
MTRRCAFACAVLVACGGSPAVDAPGGLCSDQAPLPPTFTSVQQIFTARCTTCHGASVELDLAPQVSYANLVNRVAPNYSNPFVDESCGGVLVKPGDPTASYLYQKLAPTPCAGASMPRTDLGLPSPIPNCELAAIHDWIAGGAANN